MPIQKFKNFNIDESSEWKEDYDFVFPCHVSTENPTDFPCLQLSPINDGPHHLILWSVSGQSIHSFEIPSSAYSIETSNPGPEQMIKINPWSNWIRQEKNRDEIIDLREFIEDMSSDPEELNVSDELELILDVCDMGHITVPYVDEIGKNFFLAKLSNGMESEIELDETGPIKKICIFQDGSSKKPLIIFRILPSPEWIFNFDNSSVSLKKTKFSSGESPLIKSLIKAVLNDKISDEHKKTIIRHYDVMLDNFSRMHAHGGHRRDIDKADDEIVRYKSLVSKYIGEKMAEELYRKSKISK